MVTMRVFVTKLNLTSIPSVVVRPVAATCQGRSIPTAPGNHILLVLPFPIALKPRPSSAQGQSQLGWDIRRFNDATKASRVLWSRPRNRVKESPSLLTTYLGTFKGKS